MYDFAIRLWEVVRETAAWDLVPMLFAFAGALFAVYVADRLFFEFTYTYGLLSGDKDGAWPS